MGEPKYFELQAQTTLDLSNFIKPELATAQPPKGIYVTQGKGVCFHTIKERKKE